MLILEIADRICFIADTDIAQPYRPSVLVSVLENSQCLR